MNERPCEVCGDVVTHRVRWVDGREWWSAQPHAAPCAAVCVGGGLMRPTGPLFDAAHRSSGCGAHGCEGGASR